MREADVRSGDDDAKDRWQVVEARTIPTFRTDKGEAAFEDPPQGR